MASGKLFEEYRLGGKVAKNRFLRSATNDHLSDPDGMLTEEQQDLYEELAWNDVGVIITGHFGVSERYKTAFNQPLMSDDRFIPQAKIMADTAYYYGSLLYGQLSHGGLKAWKEPFDINEASREELAEVEEQFAAAAERLAKAGFDGVQVHLAHGYLLANVLDDTVNRRTDEYGGSDENRFRLVREVLEAIRARCPKNFGLLVKLSANNMSCFDQDADRGEVGGDDADKRNAVKNDYDSHLINYAKMLRDCGVDAIELSGADFYARGRDERKYFLREALLLKEAVDIPVILVGGIASLEDMEELVERGIDMISMCRPFITEPDLIPKLRDGKQTESRCLHCNSCFTLHATKFKNCVFLPESEKLEELQKHVEKR